jgi:uncharacterized protein
MMATMRFLRYELRTTDVAAARRFYANLFTPEFWSAAVQVAPLPERAAAMGAPPHWLGHVGVEDVEACAGEVARLGGQRLGPTQPSAEGGVRALLRDPFGAVLSVSSRLSPPDVPPVAWHLHLSHDQAAAFSLYAGVFGWIAGESVDLGPARGVHKNFSWRENEAPVGSMTNTARPPHIHPQWLFFFAVPALEAALANVGTGGGRALAPVATPRGDAFAACEDPLGAAFGLFQAKSR